MAAVGRGAPPRYLKSISMFAARDAANHIQKRAESEVATRQQAANRCPWPRSWLLIYGQLRGSRAKPTLQLINVSAAN